MDMEKPQPVLFRAVLEWTLPDADPWNPREYGKMLEAVKVALESAVTVNCKDVLIRESETIGPNDNYEDRNKRQFDWFLLRPDGGRVFGAAYPLAAADPGDLAKIWELTSKAEAGEVKDTNIAIAIGRALRPESNIPATIARAFILRALQELGAVAAHPSPAVFEKAATFPFERALIDKPDLLSVAPHFAE
jgi:hypothetical protein